MPPDMQHHFYHEQSLEREKEIEAAQERVARGEEPWTRYRGIAAVVEAVKDIRFPADREGIAARAGDRVVELAVNQRADLRGVLSKMKADQRFLSLKDFHTSVQRHWEGIRHLKDLGSGAPRAPQALGSEPPLDSGACLFCGAPLENAGPAFMDHVRAKASCREAYEAWKERLDQDRPSG